MNDRLEQLTRSGVSIWLDDLSRQRLRSGSLARLVAENHVTGVTTNPSIFAAAIGDGRDYRDQIADLAARGAGTGEALRELTMHDVRDACDVLRPVYDRTDGVDGRVSIEVDARLAHDTDGMIAEARALWWGVDRPNLFIKVPATTEGLPVITACLAEGISINVTLIFSLHRYDQVIEAFLEGMERARQSGIPPTPHRLGGVFLRLPCRHRRRCAVGCRCRSARRAARSGGDRQRASRLRTV